MTTLQIGLVGDRDDGITAQNFAFGPGNDIVVTTGALSITCGNDKGIRAGG